jgi:transcriptional/translational regulatory protein YebC/TACO1
MESPESENTPTPREQWDEISRNVEADAEDIRWGSQEFAVMVDQAASRSEVKDRLEKALDLYSVNPERERALQKVAAALEALESSEGSEQLLDIAPVIKEKVEQYLDLPS